MPITPQVLDELLKDYKTPEDMLGSKPFCCFLCDLVGESR